MPNPFEQRAAELAGGAAVADSPFHRRAAQVAAAPVADSPFHRRAAKMAPPASPFHARAAQLAIAPVADAETRLNQIRPSPQRLAKMAPDAQLAAIETARAQALRETGGNGKLPIKSPVPTHAEASVGDPSYVASFGKGILTGTANAAASLMRQTQASVDPLGISPWRPLESLANRTSDASQAMQEDIPQQSGLIGQTIESGGAMVPTLATGVANPLMGAYIAGSQAAESKRQSMEKAINRGGVGGVKSTAIQGGYGVAEGLPELFGLKLLGRAAGLVGGDAVGGTIGKVIGAVERKLGGLVGRKTAQAAVAAGAEVPQELVTQAVQNAIDLASGTGEPGQTITSGMGDAAKQALLLGGALGGGARVIRGRVDSERLKSLKDYRAKRNAAGADTRAMDARIAEIEAEEAEIDKREAAQRAQRATVDEQPTTPSDAGLRKDAAIVQSENEEVADRQLVELFRKRQEELYRQKYGEQLREQAEYDAENRDAEAFLDAKPEPANDTRSNQEDRPAAGPRPQDGGGTRVDEVDGARAVRPADSSQPGQRVRNPPEQNQPVVVGDSTAGNQSEGVVNAPQAPRPVAASDDVRIPPQEPEMKSVRMPDGTERFIRKDFALATEQSASPGFKVTDVTPAGYGPGEGVAEDNQKPGERLPPYDPVELQKLKNAVNELDTYLRGNKKLAPDARESLVRQLERRKKQLTDIENFEPGVYRPFYQNPGLPSPTQSQNAQVPKAELSRWLKGKKEQSNAPQNPRAVGLPDAGRVPAQKRIVEKPVDDAAPAPEVAQPVAAVVEGQGQPSAAKPGDVDVAFVDEDVEQETQTTPPPAVKPEAGTAGAPPKAPTSDTGIFGQEIFRPATGNQQGGLFHEPVNIETPTEKPIGSKNATDPKHTAAMFDEAAKPSRRGIGTAIHNIVTGASTPKYATYPRHGDAKFQGRRGFVALPGGRSANDTSPFSDPEAEKRFQAAKGMDRPGILSRLAEGAATVAKEFRRRWVHLDTKRKTDAMMAEILRIREAKIDNATGKARRAMQDVVGKLTRKQYDRFTRMLILPDILKDIDAGKYENNAAGVPFFGRTGDTDLNTVRSRIERELAFLDKSADAATKNAAASRNAEVRKLTEYMVELKLLPPSVLSDDRYYHRQVMEYLNAREYATTGGKGPDAKMRTRGFQIARKGGGDFNTAFEQAEHEYLTHAFRQIATAEALNEVEERFDISKGLRANAKQKNLLAAFGGEANYQEFLALKADKRAAFETGMEELRDWKKANGDRLNKLWVTRAEDTDIAKSIERLYQESGSTSKQGDDFDEWYLDDEELADMPPAKLAQRVLSKPDDFGPDAVMAANWFFRAMANKRAKIKQLAGVKFVRLEDLIPDDHALWSPKANTQFARVLTIPESILAQVESRGRVLTEADTREMFARVPGKQYVIPQNFADQLDESRDVDPTALARLGAKINASWKQWTLLNPLSALRFNLNNLSGDMDVAIAGDPRIVAQTPNAAKDLIYFARGKANEKTRAELERLLELGVLNSGEALNEIPDISSEGIFRSLTGGSANPLKWSWDKVRNATTLRENVFRLAAYRQAMKRVQSGDTFYWSSKRSEIDAIDDKQLRAAKLARELIGDYGNISHAGQWIRRHAIPFWSWMEINLPRYARLLRNAPYDSRASRGRIAAAAGARAGTTVAAASMSGRAILLYAAIATWNAVMFPGEDDGIEDGRLRLLLNKTADGRTISIRFQGAFSDAMSWFGAEDVVGKIGRVRRGESSASDELEKSAKAPANKIINAAVPIQKGLAEAATGKSLFPNAFNPRTIRNRGEHLAGVFSFDEAFRAFNDIPQGNVLTGVIANSADTGEQAYLRARRAAIQWKEKAGKESGGGEPTERSNALFYYKRALALGNKDQARRWMQRYVKLGGNRKGYEQSMKLADPINFVSKNDRRDFFSGLSTSQKTDLRKAAEWYKRTYKPPR